MLLEPVNARRGLTADVETEYRAALRLSPQYAPAAVNLADLYGHLRKEGEGESVLRTTLALAPDDAGLHYALGLVLVRLKRQDEALDRIFEAMGPRGIVQHHLRHHFQ